MSGIGFVLGAGFGAVIALLFMILKRLRSIEQKLTDRSQGPGGTGTELDK
jgi:hypothetical protein